MKKKISFKKFGCNQLITKFLNNFFSKYNNKILIDSY